MFYSRFMHDIWSAFGISFVSSDLRSDKCVLIIFWGSDFTYWTASSQPLSEKQFDPEGNTTKVVQIALFNEFFSPDSQGVDVKPNLKRDINRPISIYCDKIQPNTIELSKRLREINPTNVLFIPQSFGLRSIVLGWILYRNWSTGVYLVCES